MLEQWKWSARHLVFVFRYYVRKCSFGNAPIFSESHFDRAASHAKLDKLDWGYYKQLIEWRNSKCDLSGVSIL